MTTGSNKIPDFFKEEGFDPVESATGYARRPEIDEHTPPAGSKTRNSRSGGEAAKKKAGFYLSLDILNRFTHKYHELKLAGVEIDNKSTLLELALTFALDDLDKGKKSRMLQKLGG